LRLLRLSAWEVNFIIKALLDEITATVDKNLRGLKGDCNLIGFSKSNIIFLIGQIKYHLLSAVK